MKVLNLCCADQHRFEGWFASEADFQSQMERSLLACPVCDDKVIARLPSAPRLGKSRSAEAAAPNVEPTEAAPATEPRPDALSPTAVQARWLQAMRQMVNATEDVGDRFPEEARRIHYGEAEERGIRGRASKAEAEALRDEGIEVTTVVLPEPLKGSLQ